MAPPPPYGLPENIPELNAMFSNIRKEIVAMKPGAFTQISISHVRMDTTRTRNASTRSHDTFRTCFDYKCVIVIRRVTSAVRLVFRKTFARPTSSLTLLSLSHPQHRSCKLEDTTLTYCSNQETYEAGRGNHTRT